MDSRWLLGTHVALMAAGVAFLLLTDLPPRHVLWTWVALYHATIGLTFTYAKPDKAVIGLWRFLIPLSLFQITPDWFLCTVLETLTFPAGAGDTPVPLYMGGLWVFPLMLTTWVGLTVKEQHGRSMGYIAAAVAGFFVFVGGELGLTAVPIWEAVDVRQTFGVAWYIVPAEMMLSAATLYAYDNHGGSSFGRSVGAAALVMVFYVGAAGTSYLVVEQWLLGL